MAVTFIPRSLMALAFCAIVLMANPKESFVTIDSLAGTAEVQKQGQQQWKPVSLGAKLYSNDLVRALDKSFARIGWPDGTTSYIRANSQVLINMFETPETNIVSTHLTILYGAVFFVVREVLPKAFTKVYDTKVYTPTAVVSVRGTSFAVEVDDKNAATLVKVTAGTVLVRNTAMNVSSFICAGFQTSVELKTDPIAGRLLLDKDIENLKTWVPRPVIEQEIAAQLAKAARDHQILGGGFRDKLVVLPFENRSRYNGEWNIGRTLAEQLLDQLKQNDKNLTIEGVDTVAVDPIKYGEEKKARFVIIGDVEDFDVAQHAEMTVAADNYSEYYIAKVRVRIQLINVADKKLAFDNTFTGETRGKNGRENSWQKIGKLPFSMKDAQFSKSILGSSLQQVMDQSSEKILQFVNYQ